MTSSRPVRLAASAAIAVLVLLVLAPNALAGTSVTASGAWFGARIVGTTPGGAPTERFAGLLGVSLDGQPTWAYCIEINQPLQIGVPQEEAEWAESNVRNLANVARILDRYPADATVARRDAVEAAAVQAAIWHFTDGFELVSAPPGVRERYDAIVSDAAANPVSEPAASLALSPESQSGSAGSALPVTVASSGSTPVTLSLTPADGAQLVDCATGAALGTTVSGGFPTQVCVRRDAAGGPVTVLASTTARVPAGRVFLRQGSQSLILAAGRTVVTAATASLTWTDVPSTGTPPVTTTTPPVTTTTPPDMTTTATPPSVPITPRATSTWYLLELAAGPVPAHGYRPLLGKAVLGAKASSPKPTQVRGNRKKPRKERAPINIPFTP